MIEMGNRERKSPDDHGDDGDDLYKQNEHLMKLLRQKDNEINKLKKEMDQLKARIETSKLGEKDKMIEKLNSEISKLKNQLAVKNIFSP